MRPAKTPDSWQPAGSRTHGISCWQPGGKRCTILAMRLPPSLRLLPLLLLPGCCSLARLFCGPDSTAWVQIDYRTPTATVTTLVEAIRRDAPDVVYECLAASYRREQGLDSTSMAVVWQQLRERVPGLHLAGYAKVPTIQSPDGRRASCELLVEGHRLQLELQREAHWEIDYRRPDGSPGRDRRAVQAAPPGLELVPEPAEDEDRSVLRLPALPFAHEGQAEVLPGQVEQAGYVARWKISGLREVR